MGKINIIPYALNFWISFPRTTFLNRQIYFAKALPSKFQLFPINLSTSANFHFSCVIFECKWFLHVSICFQCAINDDFGAAWQPIYRSIYLPKKLLCAIQLSLSWWVVWVYSIWGIFNIKYWKKVLKLL